MKRLTMTLSAFALSLASAGSAKAQYYAPSPTFVPHSTTHIDYVRHGGHFHAVPHTTTHFHAVPNGNYAGHVGYGGYNSGYGGVTFPGPIYVPHTTTHIDYVRHGGHFHAVPHTTTHFARIR